MKEGEDFLKSIAEYRHQRQARCPTSNRPFTPSLEEYRRMWGLSFPFLRDRATLYSAALKQKLNPNNVHDKTLSTAFAPDPRSSAGCTCRPERRRAATGCSGFPAFNKSSPEDGGKTQSTQRGNNIKLR